MKRAVILFIFILSIYNTYALSNITQTHQSITGGGVLKTQEKNVDLGLSNKVFEAYSSAQHLLFQEKVVNNLSYQLMSFNSQSAEVLVSVEILNNPLGMINQTLSNNVGNNYDITINGSLTKSAQNIYDEYIMALNSSSKVIINSNELLNEYIYNGTGSGYSKGALYYEGAALVYPFESRIISFDLENTHYIVVYGVAIEGVISGLRHLKEELTLFEQRSVIKHYYDISGLRIYDYMHLPENQKYYLTKTDEFVDIQNKSLNGLVDEVIIDVQTPSGVMLRSMRLDALNSEKILEFQRSNDSLPIVFAGGLFSNLYAWKELATEMTEEGENCFLVEITGGPGQDCDSCVNYNYSDLTDEYWPALISTVIDISNGSRINYVGHSNGGRTGLSSLEKYNQNGKNNTAKYRKPNTTEWITTNLPANPVHKYIAIGTPGAFQKETIQTWEIKRRGNQVIENLEKQNFTHTTMNMLIGSILTSNVKNEPKSKISLNLWRDYYFFINSTEDLQPGVNLSLNEFHIVAGDYFWTNDMIVTVDDEKTIFNQINSDYKTYYQLGVLHTSMCENKKVQALIKSYINQ